MCFFMIVPYKVREWPHGSLNQSPLIVMQTEPEVQNFAGIPIYNCFLLYGIFSGFAKIHHTQNLLLDFLNIAWGQHWS